MPEIVNEFAFSWSRHKMFYECPRKLYWQYYGSWGGWRPDAPKDARLAYRLKHMKNLTMLVGETFHHELAEILRRRAPSPSGVPVGQLKADMERRLLRRLRESRNSDWERYGDPKSFALLFEDYYGAGVTAEMESGALDHLRRCVDGFADDGFGRRAFGTQARNLRYVDPKSASDGCVRIDGLLVYASPDLIAEGKAGGVHIVDWKTGLPRDLSVAQLAIYGMFVHAKFNVALEQITAHLIYVSAGTRREQNVAEGVEEARRAISTYVADVKARLTDVPANVAGDIERFPMTEHVTRCRSCKFRELCGRMDDAPAGTPLGG